MSGYARLKVRGLLTKSNRKKFLQRPMKATKRTATSLTFPFALFAFLNMALAADNRLPWAPSALHWFAPGSYFSAPRRMSVCSRLPPRKVSAAKMFRKPKEFAQHFKRHFLNDICEFESSHPSQAVRKKRIFVIAITS